MFCKILGASLPNSNLFINKSIIQGTLLQNQQNILFSFISDLTFDKPVPQTEGEWVLEVVDGKRKNPVPK